MAPLPDRPFFATFSARQKDAPLPASLMTPVLTTLRKPPPPPGEPPRRNSAAHAAAAAAATLDEDGLSDVDSSDEDDDEGADEAGPMPGGLAGGGSGGGAAAAAADGVSAHDKQVSLFTRTLTQQKAAWRSPQPASGHDGAGAGGGLGGGGMGDAPNTAAGVMSGYLHKMGGQRTLGRAWHERYVILREAVLEYYISHTDASLPAGQVRSPVISRDLS